MESPSKVLPPPHEVLGTPSNQEDPLSDVIERIERINIDATHSQSIQHYVPSHKFPLK